MVPLHLLLEKDAKLSEKDVELQQLHREKDAKLWEKDVELQRLHREKDAKLWEKDAELQKLHLEAKQLLLRQHQLEVLQVRSLLTAGRVTLRGVLEHVFKVNGFGTGEPEMVKLMKVLDKTVVKKCKAEDAIKISLRGRPVTADSLGKKLHGIWKHVCEDLHPQISPKDWRLAHPDDKIILKTNGETQSDVLLLYHVLSHFGYPVHVQELVPNA